MIPAKKIGITGMFGVGKSDVVAKVIKLLKMEDLKVGGMTTRKVIPGAMELESVEKLDDVEKENVRAIQCTNIQTGECGIFSLLDIEKETIIPDGFQDLATLNNIGVTAMEKAFENDDVVVIDEIQKASIASKDFSASVEKILDGDKMVIMTLHKRSRETLLQEIRRRNDIRILDVTSINRCLLPYKIIKIIRANKR